jgi:hypothetical protein
MVTYVAVGMSAHRAPFRRRGGCLRQGGHPFSRPLVDLVRFGHAGAAHPVNR